MPSMAARSQNRSRNRSVGRVLLLAALAVTTAASSASAQDRIAARGQDVVIIEDRERTVYEFRQGGALRSIRIEPVWGPPYWLVPRDPTRGYGNLEEADMLVPQWRLFEF